MRNKRRKIFKILPGIVILTLVILKCNFDSYKMDKELEEIHKKYQSIARADSLNNIVLSTYSYEDFRYSPAIVFICLDDQQMYKIYASVNPDYYHKGIKGIFDVLESGNKLTKNIGNDTIHVFKTYSSIKESYYFILEPPEDQLQ